jgi:hypothetical protein
MTQPKVAKSKLGAGMNVATLNQAVKRELAKIQQCSPGGTETPTEDAKL